MNKYELTLVVSAKIDEEARTAVVDKVKSYIEKANATITDVNECNCCVSLLNIRLNLILRRLTQQLQMLTSVDLRSLLMRFRRWAKHTTTSFSLMQTLMFQLSLRLTFVLWNPFLDIFALD